MTEYCHYHPSNEATIRCAICGTPICRDCAQAAAHVRSSYNAQYDRKMRQYRQGQITSQPIRPVSPAPSVYYRYYCIPCNTTRILSQKKAMKRTATLFWAIAIIGLIFVGAGIILKQYVEQMDLESYSEVVQVIIALFVVVGGSFFNLFVVLVFVIIAIFISCNLRNFSKAADQAVQVKANFDATVIKRP